MLPRGGGLSAAVFLLVLAALAHVRVSAGKVAGGANAWQPEHLDAGLAYAARAIRSVEAAGGAGQADAQRLRAELDALGAIVDRDELASALRTLLEAIRRLGVSVRPPASRSTDGVLSKQDAAPPDPGIVSSFMSWALDRPVPWERDCSCCYPTCPGDRWCIKQADKRYLACAGYSVRQHLTFLLVDRPLLSFLIFAIGVGLADRWLSGSGATSAGRPRRARAKSPREKEKGEKGEAEKAS